MKPFRPSLIAFALVTTTVCTLSLRGVPEAEAAAGRALVKRYADAVVGVELVVTLKVKVGDREQPPREQRVDVNGTMVSASGLTVASLAQVDPAAAFESLRASQPNFRAELVGVDFKEVKLRLADGSEVPARFVLKDADLDLAFMAPDYSSGATKREFSFVKLDDAAEGVVLGSYFYVARAPKAMQRVPMVRSTEISGIVEKPRKFYLVTQQILGTPVFDVQGHALGITLQSASAAQPPVVLPASDIAEMTKQAAAAQSAPPPPAPAAAAAAPEAAPPEEKKD